MASRAYGRMVFWEGASLWVFGVRPGDAPFPATTPHSHHAVQVTIALRGGYSLTAGERTIRGIAGAVAPDTEHVFQGDEIVAHLFIDPEGRAGREIQSSLFADTLLVEIPASRLGDLPERMLAAFEAPRRNEAALVEVGRALVAHLAPSSERDGRPEARVRKMSAWANEHIGAPISLADAAAHVGLSTGRARHLFVEETGLPFRTYLLWLRLTRAVELFSDGSSLTQAAHGAGFSDSSHLSRTFRRMFGIAADTLVPH